MESFRPVGPAALVATAAGALAAPGGLPPAVRYGPLFASALLLGMPHGAVDHLLTTELLDGTRTDGVGGLSGLALAGATRRGWVAVGAVYAVAGGAYGLVWLAAPVAATALFVLVTWFHWGQGDLYHLLASAGATHLRTPGRRAATLLVRGGLPMLVPLVGFPDTYRQVVVALARVVAPGATAPAWPFAAGTRLALAAAFGAATLATLAWGWTGADTPARRRAWRVDAGETLLLWAYFLVVPPVLAIGVYFSLWHALRHVRRVVALDGPANPPSVAGAAAALDADAVVRFARRAGPNTVAALALAAALYAASPTGERPLALAAAYLVTIAVLTVPHTAVVTWLDRRQAVWEPG